MLPLLLALMACAPSMSEPHEDRAGSVGVQGPVHRASGRSVRTIRDEGARSTRIEVQLESGETIEVAPHHNPDRAVLSEDGTRVAWVSGASGLASVWISEVEVDAIPVQLTNRGVTPTPGARPEGWTPPPHDHSLAFDGDWLAWNSPDGPQRVRWR